MSNTSATNTSVRLAYIGCWYKNDMYAHNCSNMVDSLRANNVTVDVVTSNCRCFTSSQHCGVAKDELMNQSCSAIGLPHAPANPSKRYGLVKYYAVKTLRLDLWLAAARGFLYYWRSRQADVIHFDQVLEAFGAIPLLVVVGLARIVHKPVVANVHEIDPIQRNHKWLNHMYEKCDKVLVYSEHMKTELVRLGVRADKIIPVRYGAAVPDMGAYERNQYIYFGGHHLLKGKGLHEMLEALAILRRKGRNVAVLCYVAHGCDGVDEAKEMAARLGIASMIKWADFYDSKGLSAAYQRSKACLIPFTSGSARHPLTCAMANGTPIVATRAVDIPEYAGEMGIYVDGSPESIAKAIEEIEEGDHDLQRIGFELRKKATHEFDYFIVAQGLASLYGQITARDRLVRVTPAA